MEKALIFPDGSGPDLIVDDGGDATLLVHEGVACEKDPSRCDMETTNKEMQLVLNLIKTSLATHPNRWQTIANAIKGYQKKQPLGCSV